MTPYRLLGLALVTGATLGCLPPAADRAAEVWVASGPVPAGTKIESKVWFDRNFKRIAFTAREFAESQELLNADPGMKHRLGETPGEAEEFLKDKTGWVITKAMKRGDILSKEFFAAAGRKAPPVIDIRDGFSSEKVPAVADRPLAGWIVPGETWVEVVGVRTINEGIRISPIAHFVRVVGFEPDAAVPTKGTVDLEVTRDEATVMRQAVVLDDELKIRPKDESELRLVAGEARYTVRNRKPSRRYPEGLVSPLKKK